MTLRWRLTTAFVLVVLVPLLVGTVLVGRVVPDAVQARQAAGVASAARLAGEVLRDTCARARVTAEAAGRASTASGVPAARTAVRSLVDRGLADGVRVLGTRGQVVAAAGHVSAEPTDCRSNADPTVSAVVAMTTAGGEPAGTAIASLDVDGALLARLQEAVGEGQVVLVGERGRLVGADLDPAVATRAVRGETRVDGRVAAYVPATDGLPYGVLVLQQAAQGPGLLTGAGAVLVVAVLLAGGIAVLLARATTQPLEELGRAAARIASGDLSTVIEVRGGDEVSRLAGAFNTMTDELRDYVGQLEASRDELQAGMARLGDTLSSTHDLDRILQVVLESAMASTWATGGMVLMLTPARDELVLSAHRGLDVSLDLRIPVGEGVSGAVARHGDAARGVVGDASLGAAPGEPTGSCVIAVPLKSSGTVVGVLDLFRADPFTDSDLATIRTFAAQATVAVDNVLLHQEAQRLSITDGLTGLWNYRYFTMTVAKEIERAARFGRPLALLMLDLDHFKDVNDTYGHQRGDGVLVELASRIRAEVRDVDTVARYGGEEIVVLLPETDAAGASQLAERVCEAVRRRPFGASGEPPVHVTVSIGGAVFPSHGPTPTVLMARADEALYAAKRAGRNTWLMSEAAAITLPD